MNIKWSRCSTLNHHTLSYIIVYISTIALIVHKKEFKVAELMYILEALDAEVLLATLLVWSYKVSDAF